MCLAKIYSAIVVVIRTVFLLPPNKADRAHPFHFFEWLETATSAVE
jgi:hypothetical protein